MKKLAFFAVTMLTVLLVSCQGGYDQAKVDKLDKENPDFEVMIEQANYALDDAEKAGDIEKWEKENPKEAESAAAMAIAIALMKEDPSFPKELKEEADKLMERFEKLTSKAKTLGNSAVSGDESEVIEVEE